MLVLSFWKFAFMVYLMCCKSAFQRERLPDSLVAEYSLNFEKRIESFIIVSLLYVILWAS